MFADKVAFQRFIQRGDGLYRRIQHVHGRRETVPKQTRYADGHVNTRPSSSSGMTSTPSTIPLPNQRGTTPRR